MVENVEMRPKVGLGVMILKDGKVLLGQRRNAHGEGEYGFPGGHMEHMESFEDCARRETREEAGIEIKNVRFLRLVNLKEYAPKHYVDVGMLAEWESGEPEVKEPDRMVHWDWYDLDKIPEPQFAGLKYFWEAYRTGRDFFDA